MAAVEIIVHTSQIHTYDAPNFTTKKKETNAWHHNHSLNSPVLPCRPRLQAEAPHSRPWRVGIPPRPWKLTAKRFDTQGGG